MGQHRLVGLKDCRIFGTVAVMLGGDLPQGVALRHSVENRLLFLRCLHHGLDLGDAFNIARRDDDLLQGFLAGHLTLDDRLVAIDFDGDVAAAEIVAVNFLFQRLGGLGIVVAKTEFLSCRLNEIKQTHRVAPFVSSTGY
jgi:hypothetical protein